MKFKLYRVEGEQYPIQKSQAMAYHRGGCDIAVETYVVTDLGSAKIKTIVVHGATQTRADRDENRDYCKRIVDELESYIAGDVRVCPNCGETHARAWDEVGDVFQCPNCGSVDDVDDWEQLDVYNYMEDALDIEYIIASTREFQSARVYVTLGGPSCWIDTERRTVELRWGGESACYGLLSDTVDAVEEWAREQWELC